MSVAYSKTHPFHARLRVNRRLNGAGSAKDTRHLEVDLGGSGLTYTCGDSLGVLPENAPEAVAAILGVIDADPEDPVTLPRHEGPATIREALRFHLSLAQPTRKVLQCLRERATDPGEQASLDDLLGGDRDVLRQFLVDREWIDLLEGFPSARFDGQAFVDAARPLAPRLYSIASSPLQHPEAVHLTVAVVRYRTNERDRIGVASTYLADRVALDADTLPVYIASSTFGLPEDPARDLIMVGPGTGIAPFRAFLQERAGQSGVGRHWLFFGDQHRESDYLYGDELEAWHASGALDRLDLAFSRDQAHKVYVQDRMREQATALWSWLERGAIFYVCGDATRMARDVEQALLDIIAGEGGLDEREAKDYLRQMRKEKRYQRDVY